MVYTTRTSELTLTSRIVVLARVDEIPFRCTRQVILHCGFNFFPDIGTNVSAILTRAFKSTERLHVMS